MSTEPPSSLVRLPTNEIVLLKSPDHVTKFFDDNNQQLAGVT